MNVISALGRNIKDIADGSLLRGYTSAVILAAGSGTRMGADRTKQWLLVAGVPVVVRTLLTFNACKYIDEIILCAKADELSLYDGIAERYKLSKLKCVIEGGATRQESALEGFKRISDKADLVAIHDAARCLVTEDMIERTVRAARRDGGACAAQRATDTVKRADGKGHIIETPDRSTVWLAQTPQIFDVEQYRIAAYMAIKDGATVTDDASLMEHSGFNVTLVDCGKENIKLTEPTDMLLAEAILKMRETKK